MSGSIIREKPFSFASIRQNTLTNGNSPLKAFTHAKNTIIEIFKQISIYVNESNLYLNGARQTDETLFSNEKCEQIEELTDKIQRILSIISRNHMKVVFFGRTSNGKSSVMNAMLREKILPTGLGHTTNCFLQIEGTETIEPSVLIPGSEQPKNVNNLNMLSSALSREKLDSNSLVKILWPRDKCRLIRDDVILVDSPGIDVSTNLDQWIEDYCLDADVFVLVVSAESTIAGAEKNFLHNVAKRLSNPNIFLLMNRWDAAVNEPEFVESVKQQHLDRGLEFLCDELNLYNRKDASEHRMFFVSAREALLNRNTNPNSPTRGGYNDGYKERLVEFHRFENEFEKCISKSAIDTKFQQHTISGKEIMKYMSDTFLNFLNTCQTKQNQCEDRLDQYEERYVRLEQDFKTLVETFKERIQYVSEDVYKRVAQTLNDEIKRLYSSIEEFDRPFTSEYSQLPLYKQDLHQWLDEHLNSNLQNRLHFSINSSLDSMRKDIQETVKSSLTNEKYHNEIDSIYPRTDFVISYRLDCSNLCSDFQEDIQFQFSLGLSALVNQMIHKQTQTKFTYSSLLLLGASAFLGKNIGWKALSVVGCIYGGFYLYERLMWTKTAQERAFKRQYADYASSKMKLIVDLTAGNASAQVKQELSRYLAETIHYIDCEKDEVFEQINELKNDINQIKTYLKQGRKYRQQAEKIDNQLNQFIKQYLTTDSTN